MINEWLDELARGLELAIAHYQQRAAAPAVAGDGMDPGDVGVTVGGRQLPAMDPDQMKLVIQSALNTFSLIQTIVFNWHEII